MVKNLPSMQEIWVLFLSREDLLKKGMAYLGISAWKIPWTEESSELQSMASERVGHNSASNSFTNHFFLL